jgi:hypothetical protein
MSVDNQNPPAEAVKKMNTNESDHMEKQNDNIEKLLGKMVDAIGGIKTDVANVVKSHAALEARLSRLEKPVRKEVPPKMDAQSKPTDDYNPETGEDARVYDHRSKDSTVDAGTNWASDKGTTMKKSAQVKKAVPAPAPAVDIEGLVRKAVEETNKAWETKIPELIKAHTPLPAGYPTTEEGRMAATDIVAFVRKAIEADRANCGGTFNTMEGGFGWKTGEGNDNAKAATAGFLKKALGRAA